MAESLPAPDSSFTASPNSSFARSHLSLSVRYGVCRTKLQALWFQSLTHSLHSHVLRTSRLPRGHPGTARMHRPLRFALCRPQNRKWKDLTPWMPQGWAAPLRDGAVLGPPWEPGANPREGNEGKPPSDHTKPRDLNLPNTTCWKFITTKDTLNLKQVITLEKQDLILMSNSAVPKMWSTGPRGLQGPCSQNYIHSECECLLYLH